MIDFLQRWEMNSCTEKGSKKTAWYLKDWHIHLALPDYHGYETPLYFQKDWLNAWYDQRNNDVTSYVPDDYRFVYMGGIGTKTPLHFDVFKSFSWSVNLCGSKKWILFQPDLYASMLDDTGRNLVLDISDVKEELPCFEIIQKSNEALFVPSGWIHQVENLEDTISVNHNWINEYNLHTVYEYFIKEWKAVQSEIEHLKSTFHDEAEWVSQCHVLFKANLGLSWSDFASLVPETEKAAFNFNF